MGFLSNIFSSDGGYQGAELGKPINDVQVQEQRKRALDALEQQQSFVNATQRFDGLNNQQNTYNALEQVANGQGPNPAQAQLANATGANVANQAALMASQRGAGANAGLIARQAAQAGAGIQQNAAGQAAALQANQSLNALNQLGGIAGQQVGQQQNALNAYDQGQQNLYSTGIGALNQDNANKVGQSKQQNDMIGQQTAAGQKFFSNLVATGATAAGVPGGGGVAKAEGGMIHPAMQHLSGKPLAQGGNVGSKLKTGGKVPGTANVGGTKDSYSNDNVQAVLSPGEIVLPRSVTKSKDPVGNAAKFVQAVMAKQNMKRK